MLVGTYPTIIYIWGKFKLITGWCRWVRSEAGAVLLIMTKVNDMNQILKGRRPGTRVER